MTRAGAVWALLLVDTQHPLSASLTTCGCCIAISARGSAISTAISACGSGRMGLPLTPASLGCSGKQSVTRSVSFWPTPFLGIIVEPAAGQRLIWRAAYGIIVCDYNGLIHTLVKVVKTWASCRLLCKPSNTECGDLVFVGGPSEREARRFLQAVDLKWPQAIKQ